MSQPQVVCVDFTPHPFEQFDEKPTLSQTVLPNCVRMVYDTAALDNTSFQKGANVFAVFIGTSSRLRFGFFYQEVSHVDESLDDALARCMLTQTDEMLTKNMNRWGDLNVPFCNLLGGSATHRPADEAVHAGATLLTEIKCRAGKVLDYVREDGQTVAVVVGMGVLPPHVGAALARAIHDGTCVAMYCQEGVHPCDKTSVFWLALEALHAFTYSKTPVALPEVPEAHASSKRHKPNAPAQKRSILKAPTTHTIAPTETVELKKKVHNVETPQVFVRRFHQDTWDTTFYGTLKIPWAEPPHREKETGDTERDMQSARWKQAGWKCIETKTMHIPTNPVTGKVFEEELSTKQLWDHPHYGLKRFSRCDMNNAVRKIDRENSVFEGNQFYPVNSFCLGPGALFRASGSPVNLTRAEVRARITAEENAAYEAAGFTCALVDDELRFCQGGVMPKMEEWSHETYEPGRKFARDEMPEALRCLQKQQTVPTLAQRLGAPRSTLFLHGQ